MLSPETERIMKENKKYAQMLEYYDRTGRSPFRKERKNFTLKEMNLDKLKKMSKKNSKSMSAILDELISKA